MLDFFIVLVRRKKTFLGLSASVTILTILFALLVPKRFTANAAILPPQQSSSISAAILSQVSSVTPLAAAAGGGLGIKNPSDLYVAMLTSRTVEDALIAKFGLQREYEAERLSDARKELEARSSVVSSPKDGLIRIAVEHSNPAEAAAIANGYVDELKRLAETLAVTEAAQRRLFFEKQIEEVKGKLAVAENSLKQMQQSSGVIHLDGQARALIESAAMLRAQVTAKELQVKSIGSYATESNPEMAQARQQLSAMKQELSRLSSDDRSSSAEMLVPKARLPLAVLEHLRRLRDVKYHEAVFELLSKQLELAKLDEARQGGVIQVVDRAIPPDKQSFPRRGPVIVVGFLIALLVSALTVVSLERWESAMTTPEVRAKWVVLSRLLHGGNIDRRESQSSHV
jgi:uncharacterized protein involved in exopolysaccharide biosynthesis